MTISAKIIADSISELGQRITTFELEYPRFIHAELLTHRLMSKNSSSSRAVPVQKAIELIRTNTAGPSHWGKHQSGMQAKEECNSYLEREVPYVDDEGNVVTRLDGSLMTYTAQISREQLWNEARDAALEYAEIFMDLGYHKQVVNRITEPFSHIKVCLTATNFSNFLWLRDHSDAQPEIMLLAKEMKKELENSIPKVLTTGEWHLPYYGEGYWEPRSEDDAFVVTENIRNGIIPTDVFDENGISLSDALKISSSCCAQTSYRRTDDSLEKATNIYEKLVGMEPPHFSPFEHQAMPMCSTTSFDDCAVTHLDRYGSYWSGNFEKWIQHRQIIMNDMNIKLMNSIKGKL